MILFIASERRRRAEEPILLGGGDDLTFTLVQWMEEDPPSKSLLFGWHEANVFSLSHHRVVLPPSGRNEKKRNEMKPTRSCS